MDPLKQLKAFMYAMEDYIGGLQTRHRASVFKCHPGRRTVMLTDNASGAFYFGAPTHQLDRESASRVGCGVVGLTGEAVPLLLSNGERHRLGRAVMNDILAARRAAFWPALNATFEDVTARWLAQGGFSLKLAIREFMMDFVFRWILDARLPMFTINHLDELVYFPGIWTDTVATRALTPLFKRPFTPEADRCRDLYAKAAKDSPLFAGYVQMARHHGLPLDDFEHFLAANMIANMVGAPRLVLFPTMARLGLEQTLVERMIAERAGRDWTPRTLLEAPVLDAAFLEANRLYPRPRFMYKIAQADLEVPASDGRRYRVREGDAVCVCFPQVNRDPLIYSRPNDFWPDRYLDDPALREKLYLFSWREGAEHPYGCLSRPGREGEAIVKFFMSRLATEFAWDYVQTPIFDKNLYLEVGPVDLSVMRFRRRGEG